MCKITLYTLLQTVVAVGVKEEEIVKDDPSTQDELVEVNLVAKDEPCSVFVSKKLSNKEMIAYIDLLIEFRDVLLGAMQKYPDWIPSLLFITSI